MGAWWDRKGENEIDLVCEDEAAKSLNFHEVKTDAQRIDLDALRLKSAAFFAKNPGLKGSACAFAGLSLNEM